MAYQRPYPMKNLAFHKKQVREHRMRNIRAQAESKIDAIGDQVLARSQARFDEMIRDLKLQRCKLEQRQRERIPLPVRQLMAATNLIVANSPFPW
jgi:hypothetical protein